MEGLVTQVWDAIDYVADPCPKWRRSPSNFGWLQPKPKTFLDSVARAWNLGSGSADMVYWANKLYK